MPAILNSSSTMMCPHGGTVMATPGQSQAQAGSPILRVSDTCTIAGCTFNVSGVPSPCVSVQWVQGAGRVSAGGSAVLNESSVGLCVAATQAPQGSVIIAAGQPNVQAL